jgi:hypothetical protein
MVAVSKAHELPSINAVNTGHMGTNTACAFALPASAAACARA